MAIAVDLTIELDVPYGSVDYATLEHAIHTALAEVGAPVIDVAIDQTRPLDTALPGNVLPPLDYPLGPAGAPVTRAPGARI